VVLGIALVGLWFAAAVQGWLLGGVTHLLLPLGLALIARRVLRRPEEF
jgi:hypothetical protein